MRSCTALLPTIAMLLGSSTAMAMDDFGLQIHGFASQGYLRTDGDLYVNGLYGRDTNSGTFELNEFAVNVTATPIDRLRIGAQFIAYDLGKYGNDEVQIDWAFGQYQIPTDISWLDVNFVAGRFKTGHGFYNDFRDLDMTRTSVFLPRATYSAEFRDFFLATNGGQLNCTLRSDSFGSLDLSGFVGTQNVEADDGPIFDIIKNGIALTPIPGGITLTLQSTETMIIERMSGGYATWNTPIDGLRFKVSNIYVHDFRVNNGIASVGGPVPAGTTTSINIYVQHWFDIMTGVEYQADELTFAAEYSNQYFKATNDIGGFTTLFGPAPATSRNTTSRGQGLYGSVNYQLALLPGRWSNFHLFAAGNYKDNNFVGTQSFEKSLMFAVRYDVANHFLVKAEFERVQEKDNTDKHTYGNVFSLKTTFDF